MASVSTGITPVTDRTLLYNYANQFISLGKKYRNKSINNSETNELNCLAYSILFQVFDSNDNITLKDLRCRMSGMLIIMSGSNLIEQSKKMMEAINNNMNIIRPIIIKENITPVEREQLITHFNNLIVEYNEIVTLKITSNT